MLLASLWLISQTLTAADFTARLSRDQLQAGETLTLTLESSAPSYFIDPDIRPLRQQFELLSSQHQSPADNEEGLRRWVFELRPLQTGTLKIPALALGELRSNPLVLRVTAAEAPISTPLFMETRLDPPVPYVHAQMLLSVRLLHALSRYADGQINLPDTEGLRILPLGEAERSRQLLGDTEYGVIEQQFAIFPQLSGTLELPAPRFIGPDTPAQGISLDAGSITFEVRAIPEQFPAEALWLPASQLELVRHWHDEADSLPFEQPLASRLLLEARGLPASYLPLPRLPAPAGLTLFENPLDIQQETSTTGLLSRVELQQLLVAQQPGDYQLEGLELPWWNTLTDQLEYARLPGRNLHIQPMPASQPLAADHSQLWPWQLACALLALASLLLMLLWLRARRLPAIRPSSRQADSQRLLEQLRKACQASQPQQARQLLDLWVRSRDAQLDALQAFSPDLQAAVRTLNQCLYAPGTHNWDGQQLRLALDALLQAERLPGSDQLPPLYPA